jgi:hypothetical protein
MDQLRDIKVNSELIIGLPGETANSWADTLFKHPELGIDFARSYPLYVLPNTPMATNEYKEEHGIKTKKVILPNKEQFEMIYECNSYDKEEIGNIYLTWWYFNTFYNFGIDKTITKQTMKDFFNNLSDMPLVSCCVEEVKLAVARIFEPGPELLLEGYDLNYLHKNLGRGKELIYFKDNIEQVRDELNMPKLTIENAHTELMSPFAHIKESK